MTSERPTVCFLDMDGVLADFYGGVCRLHMRKNPYAPPSDDVLGEPWLHNVWGWTEEQLKDGIRDNTPFWASLPLTSECHEIVEMARKAFGDNVCLLSSPSGMRAALPGKFTWIRRNLPEFIDRFLIGHTKEFVAAPHALLIDDYDHNVDAFCAAGGQAFLLPRPWNSRHDERHRPLGALREYLGLETLEP